jgi:hypothetical protein
MMNDDGRRMNYGEGWLDSRRRVNSDIEHTL